MVRLRYRWREEDPYDDEGVWLHALQKLPEWGLEVAERGEEE